MTFAGIADLPGPTVPPPNTSRIGTTNRLVLAALAPMAASGCLDFATQPGGVHANIATCTNVISRACVSMPHNTNRARGATRHAKRNPSIWHTDMLDHAQQAIGFATKQRISIPATSIDHRVSFRPGPFTTLGAIMPQRADWGKVGIYAPAHILREH